MADSKHSLSKSSSENRFRVSFHAKKPTIPSNATPPETERPMTVDWLIPLLFGAAEVSDSEDCVALGWLVAGTVVNMVVSSPFESVTVVATTVSDAVELAGGGRVVAAAVFEVVLVAVLVLVLVGGSVLVLVLVVVLVSVVLVLVAVLMVVLVSVVVVLVSVLIVVLVPVMLVLGLGNN